MRDEKRSKVEGSKGRKVKNIHSTTATRDLVELTQKLIFKGSGSKGAGSYYELM